ncbi:hypothetical protein ACGF0D_35315 [Kitasatospora sp. NPDC048298]|uniref:hypothetical protein n=1 Tax=Kitasatospora sp. NPDC048298 TaxID=3364049 RepID=UPI00371E3B63
MADDVDAPHEAVLEVNGTATLPNLLDQTAGHCLRTQGSCWVAYLGYNRADGQPLALAAPQWPRPRMLPGVSTAAQLGTPSDTVEIFWAYRNLVDAENLWRQLGRTVGNGGG